MKNTWNAELDSKLTLVAHANFTSPEEFCAMYRAESGDNVHTVGGIMTRLENTIMPGNPALKLTKGFLSDFRHYSDVMHQKRKAEKHPTKGDAPETAPAPAKSEPAKSEPVEPVSPPEWLSATEVGILLEQSDKWVPHHYKELGLVTTRIKVRGAPTRYYERTSVLKAKMAMSVATTPAAGPVSDVATQIKAVLSLRGVLQDRAVIEAIEQIVGK